MNQQQLKQLEEEYYKNQVRYTKRELLEIFPEAREYLEKEERKCLIVIDAFESIVRYRLKEISKLKDEMSRWFTTEVLGITEGFILDKYERRLKEITLFLNPWYTNKEKGNKITDEDILRAKQYSFENIINFNKSNFALCPFHNEKTPSLSLNKKNNTIHCFGSCGKSWDTIQYLIDYEGISFIEAVKKLQ